MENTTIAAITTPQGSGGVGIVRLSGPAAVGIAEQLFVSYKGKRLRELAGFCGTLGTIVDTDGTVIDEAIAFRYRAPKSYTGEEVVELSGHGGSWVTARVLRLCLAHGAIPAEAGEFTKRAFLNGKLDLIQAEGVMDIIGAQGDAALKAANQLYEGTLSKQMQQLAEKITEQAGHLAAWADYPEEDVEVVERDVLLVALQAHQEELDALLNTYDYGKILKEGIPTAIVGKPNVGKSTLMNLLTGYDRSIVSDIPGTTRDVVTESARLGDLVLLLADTAGIRSTDDPIEQKGVARAKAQIDTARLVLVLLDHSRPLDDEDKALLALLRDKPALVLVNKSDLPGVVSAQELSAYGQPVIFVSARESEGMHQLEDTLKKILGVTTQQDEQVIIANERQRLHLLGARQSLAEAIEAIQLGITLDAITVCLEDALDEILSLVGKRASERIVDQVFSSFCVGK